jgi:hypothetical protein
VQDSDLETLRGLFSDKRIHIAVAKITALELASDRSILRVKASIFPEVREIVASMSWDHVGPNAGIFAFPAVNDLVLVGMAEGDEQHAFVIRRLTSKEDKIPVQAADGSTVIRALAGKKAHLISDTAILLGGGSADPTEQAVLGNVLQTMLSSLIDAISTHTHVGNLGYPTGAPVEAASFTALKDDPVDNNAILSELVKLE